MRTILTGLAPGVTAKSTSRPNIIMKAESAATDFKLKLLSKIETLHVLSSDDDIWPPAESVNRLSGPTYRVILEYGQNKVTGKNEFQPRIAIFKRAVKENLDLMALFGTDYVVRLGLEGCHLYLQKILPRFDAQQNSYTTPSWKMITNNRWSENFHSAESLIFKHIWSKFRSGVCNALLLEPFTNKSSFWPQA